MKISCPEDILERFKECDVDRSVSRRRELPSYFYDNLEIVPECASDPKIHSLLIEAVTTAPLGYRFRASKILIEIGDPLGILHLTYNSMCTHPLLREQQYLTSGWTDAYLLRESDKLTEECVELLINDEQPDYIRHVDILATLPDENIIPRMQALLGNTKKNAMAAYVLAMKGNDEGRPVLEKLIESQKHVDFALIALSHIPDEKTMHYLRAYADPAHPIYNKKYENKSKADLLRFGLMLHAQCRLFYLECRDPYPVRRTMEHFYLHSIFDLIANDYTRSSISRELSGGRNIQNERFLWDDWAGSASRWIKPPSDLDAKLFVINSRQVMMGKWGTAINAPDFLCEFSTPEDRAYCAEIQRGSIRALLDAIDWQSLGNGSDMGVEPVFLWGMQPTGTERGFRNLRMYFPGLKLSYEKEDYEHAAVDWILNPSRYRFNSYWPNVII